MRPARAESDVTPSAVRLVDLSTVAASAPVDRSGLERPAYLGPRTYPRLLSNGTRAIVPITLVVLWIVGSAVGAIDETILPSPSAVGAAFVELYETGDLQIYVVASLRRAALGLLIGVSLGLLLGIGAGLSALGEWLLDPTVQMLRSVPFLALAPLFITWFGIDETFKVVLIAFACTFPMYAYSYLGVRNVDRKVVEAARSFGLRGTRLVVQVILPGALPNLLMALRICTALTIVGLIASEGVGTTAGIGYLVLLAKQYYRQDYMVLCIVMYAVLGLLLDAFIRALERHSMPWRRHTAVRA
ncbi:ABC transporter permease [Sandaracinus amylolyticus]|uniref:ABC transporter permease n=1 Tax=Sandaracinus amylolyticus TaxID=927083 RepID=UPI001F3E4C99|nr:ABC transporter permease [Sandaracinus amylolyticus]UJR83975.1 Hypothetical protein I5071_60460 [Sandaracinus amylolyticus]